MSGKTQIDNELITAQIAKLMAEVMKLRTEVTWYPFMVAGTVIAAVATLTVVLMKLASL